MASLDSITRGLPDGFYSTFRTYAGGTRVIGLKAHLRRLYDPVPAPDVEESEHLITWPKLLDVTANRLNLPGHISPEDRVFRF